MNYDVLQKQAIALIDGIENRISNLSNLSALLNEALDDINWVGFYLVENNQLELGPFQGKVACTPIQIGKGVCGTAVEKDVILRIDDVHTFPGHIACDSASNAEIVLPIHGKNGVVGLLDIDSPSVNRFTLDDEIGLSKIVEVIEGLF